MELPELKRVSEIAAGLDRLVPRIGQAMRDDVHDGDLARLTRLLKMAEAFFLETGPLVSRTKLEPGAPHQLCERFMRELPRRLRMIRDAQPTAPRADNLVAFSRDAVTQGARRG